MGKIYESLKEVVHQTLHPSESNPIPVATVKDEHLSNLADQIDEIEKLIAEKIDRLKAVAKQRDELVNKQTQHAGRAIERLKENIALVKAKLEETENTLRTKDSAVQNIEDTLNGKIHSLQNDLKNKDEALEIRSAEIDKLKSALDSYARHVVELDLAIEQGKSDAAQEAERHEHVTETSNAKIAALEGQLKEIQEVIREKDSTVNRLEEDLSAASQNFKSEVTNNQEVLEARDAEIKHLTSQLQFLTSGIKDTSSFFREAEALATIETNKRPVLPNDQPSDQGQDPTAPVNPKLTSSSATPVEETVIPELFERAAERLTLIIGPLAPMIVREHLRALGGCMENFPKSRLIQLVEMLSNEIPNEDLRFGFRKWFAQQFLHNLDATAVRLQS